MQRTTEFEVDGVKYATTQYPATKGLKLLTRLSKIIGKPMGVLTATGGLDAEVTPDLIGSAIEALTSQIDEEIVDKIVKDALVSTEVLGEEGRRPLNFDIDFAGRYGHLFKVLKEVLAFQYGDFFDGVVGAGALLRREGKGTKIKAR